RSRRLGTPGVDVDRIERRGRGDEQAVLLRAAEAQIRHDLGDEDLAEQGAVGPETVDAVPGARPDVAVGVEAEAVELAGVADGENSGIRHGAGAADIEGADVPQGAGPVG